MLASAALLPAGVAHGILAASVIVGLLLAGSALLRAEDRAGVLDRDAATEIRRRYWMLGVAGVAVAALVAGGGMAFLAGS
jgi:hypothetical protein